jgi:putative transposase
MKKARFTDEQILVILREAESGKVAEVVRKHGISRETLYRWRTKFRDMGLQDVKRLRQLEDENRRLKQTVAELVLDNQALKAVVGKRW